MRLVGERVAHLAEFVKDAGVVLWLALFAGLPAWLIVLTLTATRWHQSSRHLVAIQNAPAVFAVLIFAIVFLSGI